MPFTFIGVYVCLTDFILQNKETRNHPSRPPPPKKKKKRKKITRSHVPGAVASEDLEALPWFASPAVGTRACACREDVYRTNLLCVGTAWSPMTPVIDS